MQVSVHSEAKHSAKNNLYGGTLLWKQNMQLFPQPRVPLENEKIQPRHRNRCSLPTLLLWVPWYRAHHVLMDSANKGHGTCPEHKPVKEICLCSLSRVQLFGTPWTVAHQAPPSMGFPRQEHWSGLPCPSPGNLPDPGTVPMSLMPPALAGRFFTASAMWEALRRS